MKIHEYQAAALFSAYGVKVPFSRMTENAEEAYEIAKEMPKGPYVIKAQIHSGGRGKAGGVKFADTPEEAKKYAEQMLGMTLVTKQTGPQGRLVRKITVGEVASIKKEYYLSFTVDGASECVVMIASSAGGIDIEQTAAETPEKIFTLKIDPTIGLKDYQSRNVAKKLELNGDLTKQFIKMTRNLYRLFLEKDCSLIEINPMAECENGDLIAADAKINFDDNGLMRHPDIVELRDIAEEDPREVEASKFNLNYIQLDGNIGCMVNGAGLAMATMDIIAANGGQPANFLDVGGGANEEKVTGAFSILISDPNVKGIFVNIFGGIMHCDIIASGIVAAAGKLDIKVPMVVRLEGTNAEEGKRILRESGLTITPASDMADGAQKICALVAEREVR